MRFVVSVCCLAMALNAAAQQPTNLTPYQAGAGAYFAGRADEAEKHLTQAIEENPDDPRGYYLRGLNRMRVNDTRGAQSDLAKGSEIEARMGSSSPFIDQSLASLQGSARLTLERIRRAAREAAEVNTRQQVIAQAKAERESRERVVLRTDYRLPMEALASRLSVDQARDAATKLGPPSNSSAVASTPSDDPFADDTDNAASSFATTPAAPANDVDIPDAARGSMKSSSLFGLFGRSATAVGQGYVEGKTAGVAGAIPPDAIPPGMVPAGMGPGGMPPGFGPGGAAGMPLGTPTNENGSSTFELEGFEEAGMGIPVPSGGEGSPEASPFDFGE